MYRNCLEPYDDLWMKIAMQLKNDYVPIVRKLKARYGRAYG